MAITDNGIEMDIDIPRTNIELFLQEEGLIELKPIKSFHNEERLELVYDEAAIKFNDLATQEKMESLTSTEVIMYLKSIFQCL